jgi:hypothetical protein
MPPETLHFIPKPKPQDPITVPMLTDEQIWGHRLWHEQTPWLLFLEFLSVAEACYRDGRLLDEQGRWYPLTFQPNKRLHLRNILFLDNYLFRVAETYPDNHTAWKTWLQWMDEHAVLPPPRDFSYLQERFRSFHEFARLVALLQNSIIEGERNKRWSSRFVFPFGPHGIYEDLDHQQNWGRQYIYFGRTGELLYLMLCRSAQREALRPHLAAFFHTPNKWDTLLKLLQPAEDNRSTRGYSYLPYAHHATFDTLAEDWLALLHLSLPGFDAFPHLRTLGALHVMLYQVTLAAQWCHQERPVLVCEVVAPKKTLVREVSIDSYQHNNELPALAVEALIKEIETSTAWQTALSQPGAFGRCRELLQERVWWPMRDKDYDGPNDPIHLLAELRTEALRRHRQHGAHLHRSYGGGVGLISRRATNTYRYAPTDGLLKTLILTNVQQRMELSAFLAHLYRRYGLIFGEREAEHAPLVSRFDKKAFQKNAQRLEQRLGSLGMLRRLSDGCAYVENPYTRRLV